MKPNKQFGNLKRIALGVFFSVGVLSAQAQDYAFKVMASNGTNTIQGTTKRLWAGSSIASKDVIVVANGGYLGLVHSNGRTLELKQAGSYKVADLAGKVAGGKSSTSAKYVNYVAGEMAKADKADINKNHAKYMSTTGSVQRALKLNQEYAITYAPVSEDVQAGNNNKKETLFIFDPIVTLKLIPNPTMEEKSKGLTTYEVIVYDFTEKEIIRYEAQATGNKREAELKIDFSKLRSKYDPEWLIQVNFKGTSKKSDAKLYHIALLTEGSTYEAIKADVSSNTEEPTALDKIIQARAFEEKNLLLDAIRCYDEAIKMQPNVDTYKIAYQDFLVRNKMVTGKDGKPLMMDSNYKEEDIQKEASVEKKSDKKGK
jgi:hypothetical protein